MTECKAREETDSGWDGRWEGWPLVAVQLSRVGGTGTELSGEGKRSQLNRRKRSRVGSWVAGANWKWQRRGG